MYGEIKGAVRQAKAEFGMGGMYDASIPNFDDEYMRMSSRKTANELVAMAYDEVREPVYDNIFSVQKMIVGELRKDGLNEDADVLSNYRFSHEEINNIIIEYVKTSGGENVSD